MRVLTVYVEPQENLAHSWSIEIRNKSIIQAAYEAVEEYRKLNSVNHPMMHRVLVIDEDGIRNEFQVKVKWQFSHHLPKLPAEYQI